MAASTERRVIVAVDDSASAEGAFDYYARFLHRPENTVLVLHVPEPSNVTSRMMHHEQPPYEEWNKLWSEEQKKWKTLQEKYEKKLQDGNMKGSFEADPSNKPGELIVARASKDGTAMIVTGTRGLGTFRRKIMGSVSEYVVHHAHCPVVVYKH